MAGKIDAPKVERATILPKAGLQSPNVCSPKNDELKKPKRDEKKAESQGDAKDTADAVKAEMEKAAECLEKLEETSPFDPKRVQVVMGCLKYMDGAAAFPKGVEEK